MLKLLSSAVVSLCSSFSLAFPGKNKKAATDDFIPSLVLVLLRSANLKSPTASYKYLKHFGSMSESSGFEEQHRVFFESCTTYILNELTIESLDLNDHELQEYLNDETEFLECLDL